MSETSREHQKAVKIKLTNLVNCIISEAANNAQFASRLEEVLLSDSLRAMLGKNKKKSKKPTFNPVAFLQEHGSDMLRSELEKKTDSELRLVLRSEGIRKGKELKNVERQQMIDEIIANSERRLKHGTAFL